MCCSTCIGPELDGKIARVAQVPDQEGPQLAPATLGDVLYTDPLRSPVQELDWARLVEAVAAGDQLALHALYERAHRAVFTLIMRITRCRETAEELTVDVFHDVWRRAPLYDAANGTVLGWIMNQARSRAIDRLRFDQRKKRVDPHAEEEASPQGGHGNTMDLLDTKQQGEVLRRAVAALSTVERQAIEAAFFSELTYAETAVRLNQPLGTVKTRIRSALHKLREALADEGAPK